MLRIHTERNPDGVTLRLEGKLVQPWVDELARAWTNLAADRPAPHPLRIDLRGVSFVDSRGRTMLAFLRHQGCELAGSGPYITALIEEINGTFES